MRLKGLKFAHKDNTVQYEQHVFDYIDKIQKDEVFYDIGACLGAFSLYDAIQNINVYSFEVDPKNFKGMMGNIEINKLEHKIKTFNIGISDGLKKEMNLYVGQDRIGGHHKTLDTDNFVASEDIRNDNYKKIRVPTSSIDDIVLEQNIKHADHLKVDIDGSEYDFMVGAVNTLTNSKSIMIELYEGDTRYLEIIEKLVSYGFKLIDKHNIKQPNCISCKKLFNYEFRK